jgi:hypothetical protein
MLFVGSADDIALLASDAGSGAIAGCIGALRAVDLVENRDVDIVTEGVIDCVKPSARLS